MSFESPWLLTSLAIVPLTAVAYLLVLRRPPRYAVNYSNLDVLASVVGRRRDWRRHVPAVLLLGAVAALCVGLARPTWPSSKPSERASVILVVDVSGSMRATDVAPSRLEAAQSAMRTFAQRIPEQVQVGVVAFSDGAEVVVTPTRDRERLLQGITILQPGFGTAIGDALDRAVTLARTATSGSKKTQGLLRDAKGRSLATILLLSDGSQTRGVLSPGQGADLAKKAGIPVNTVALGTDEGTIIVGLGSQQQLVPVPPDRTTLSAIAEYTGGDAFDADSAEALDGVYRKLGSRVGREASRREVSSSFVALGALLAIGAVGVGLVGAPRLP